MIDAILLAAGKSRRMGTQKLLLPFGDTTVIHHIATQVLAAPVGRLIVVVGNDATSIKEALAGLAVHFAVNPDEQGDMLSSVRAGLGAVSHECQGILVVLGDQPAIEPRVLAEMFQRFKSSGGGIIVPTHAGRRGHPILFASSYIDEIQRQYDGQGLRGLLEAHPADVLEVECDRSWVLADMDHPADYERELRRHSG